MLTRTSKAIFTHRKKLKNLTKNAELPLSPNETVNNLSSYKLTNNELELLKNGLGFSIKPPEEKQWVCSKDGCGSAFSKWDNLYKHMLSHSKPLGCPACHFRTERPARLKKHQVESHEMKPAEKTGHWNKKVGRTLRTVSTVVTAHTFCASRDTRVSHG